MTNRNIVNPELISAIGEKVVEYYECIVITLTYDNVDTTYHITNAPRDITIGGNLYRHFGALINFSDIEENVSFNISKLNIGISGINPIDPNDNQPFLKKALDETTEYLDREVTIWRGYFRLDHSYLDKFEIYRGFITSLSANRNIKESIAVNIEVSNHWTDFERVTGRMTNNNSQQFWFENDLGMEFCREVMKDIEWKPSQ